MTKAIATRRPVLVEDPDDLRRQFDGELEIDPEGGAISGRARLDRPAAAGSRCAAGRAAVRINLAEKDHRGERVFLEAPTGQCQLALERAGLIRVGDALSDDYGQICGETTTKM